jgi:hypothetical protein
MGAPLVFTSSSTEVNRVISYLGPVALLVNLTVYKAGLNGAGRDLMAKLSRSQNRLSSNGRGLPVEGREPDVDGGLVAEARRAPAIGSGSQPPGIASILSVIGIAAGFLAIGLAWYHSGNTDQVWIQNQELLSGGVGGLALVVLGVGVLLRSELRQRDAALLNAIDHLAALEASRLQAVGVDRLPAEGANAPRRRSRPLVVASREHGGDA